MRPPRHPENYFDLVDDTDDKADLDNQSLDENDEKNLNWGVEELILGNLVMIKMVWIGWVVQVAPLTSQWIPLNSQGAPLTPQGVALAPRSIPWVEERV